MASQTAWVTVTGSNGGNPIIGTSAGDLQLNAGGLGKALQLTSAGTPVNYVRIQSRNTGAGPILWAEGSDTNVPMEYRTQAAGSHNFLTEGATGSTQVQITHTPSATRYITLTGATGSNNPTISTSAGALALGNGQLQFPATQNASADANTLDDYEEGTFTPVVRDAAAGNVATAAVAVGFYTKIGNAVRFNLYLTDINTAGLTAGNQVFITAMPFAASSTANSHHLHNVLSASAGPTTGSLSAIQYASTSYLQVQNAITTGTSSFLVSQLTSGSSDLFITGTYYV